ncbi:malate:quinone oxidoreductase, partial [Alicyclobacillus sp.]|uniref:malate:quinone oxidoreductase n=1 Tax=Alicyclobacillus sp. TaxID=61169 RepID=UPI0025BB337F
REMKGWAPKIREMIPSYGVRLADNPSLYRELHEATARTLGLVEQRERQLALV